MTRLQPAAIVVMLLWLAVSPRTQENELEVLLERLATYLEEYEPALSSLVADEHYVQEEHRAPPGRPNAPRPSVGSRTERRTTDAEILFLRLPGETTWFGVRDVAKMNGKAVARTSGTLADLARSHAADLLDRAAAIVEASSRYNLGGARTINTPVVPLEVLSTRNHVRHIFKLGRKARVRGAQTVRLEFHEYDEPTLVQAVDGGTLWTRGTAWIDPNTGALWRAEIIVGPDPPDAFRRRTLETRMQVDFVRDEALQLLVPAELKETFWIPGGSGSGHASYSNYRKFSTAARILPGPMD